MASIQRLTVRYGVAVLAVAAAIALVLIPVIGKGLTAVVFLAVFVSARYGGLGPGLLATMLIALIAALGLRSDPDVAPWRYVSILLFAIGGVLITLLGEAFHSARRRAEASQRWLTAVLTSIGDAVIATDGRGLVTFLNPVARSLTGWESEDAVGKPLPEIFRIVAEDTRNPVENPVDRVLRENAVVGLANHTILIGRDGTEHPIDDSGAPIRQENGKIGGVVLVFRDVTVRKSLEVELERRLAELAEAHRRKDEFLAMLAHELRNPLAAFSTAVQLTTRTTEAAQLQWCESVITRQIKHLSRLIDDLLDVSRITCGHIKLQKERLEVADILRNAVAMVRPLFDERQHTLTVAIDDGPLPALADPVRLEQIVTNLLTNAAKYTERGGQIWLSAERAQDEIVVKVRDTGIGIPPKELSQMFELFVQGDRSLARSEGGLGIGLTLARSLAELHGGSLSATSAGPDKGSEFVVRLPLASPADRARAESKPPVAQASQRRLRVLIVDDNLDAARSMAALLKLLSHQVWTAHDGPSGLEAARSYRPEIVLLDIGLPGMDGYLVAEQIRREDFGKAMRLIAVTGYGQEEDRRQAFSSGFDQFVTKPVDYATLLSLIVAPGSAAPGNM